ncbi:hypothetical protein B0H17DRAFT_1137819 [Mycena rosella]|uniref:Uncharacterized protein n=1 Tax=Mycena rosella TaxID=1033263 RepID=A0AAD7D937_MYCRO|nr:hypothetical protein B0H17DRAFT_1137819 [Mycena rosella]
MQAHLMCNAEAYLSKTEVVGAHPYNMQGRGACKVHTGKVVADFANPQVAPYIQKYPEDVASGPISEIWQVENGRWREIPLDELTPSILIGVKRFYIHEIIELTDGRWIIPALWINCRGKTYADSHLVTRVAGNILRIPRFRNSDVVLCQVNSVLAVDANLIRVSLEDFSLNHQELVVRNKGPIIFADTVSCQEFGKQIPNICREIDAGEDLFTVWMPCWADNVSGARSKQYQKHINVYTANANLLGQLLQQEYFVCFVSTSPNACALEQLKVVTEQLKSTHVTPVQCYNANTGRPCGFRANVPDGPADNPQQAEEASHIGHQGNYFCRVYKIGGTNEEKELAEGYPKFYEAGAPRNVEEIKACVLEQLRLATRGIASHVEALQTSTGTKDKIVQHWIEILIAKSREMQVADSRRSVDSISEELLSWLHKETDQLYNPLLDLQFFDPSQDTMVEILHTILLGHARYTWYNLHHNWTSTQQDLFTVRLQSTNLDGLRVPPIQAAYMMQYRNGLDLVTPNQFTLVRALGELGPLLWIPVIDDMTKYLARTLNHQASSRDIAIKFADLERVKHILSGGLWKEGSEWISAGRDVRRLLLKTLILQRHLGWAPKPQWTPGLIKASPAKKKLILAAEETMILGSYNPCAMTIGSGTAQWTNGVSVTAASGDAGKVGTWGVFWLANDLPAFVRILSILLPKGESSSATKGVLVVAKFLIGEALHFHFHMPVLVEEWDTPWIMIPSAVGSYGVYRDLILINRSHFNSSSMCSTTAMRATVMQAELRDKCRSGKKQTS